MSKPEPINSREMDLLLGIAKGYESEKIEGARNVPIGYATLLRAAHAEILRLREENEKLWARIGKLQPPTEGGTT